MWKTALHAGIGAFIMGYNIGVFTSCQPCVAATLGWGSSTELLIPIMTAVCFIGGFFGSLFSGTLKMFGRRKAIMLADWVTIVGSCIVIIPFTPCFGIGRFILGFSSGMFNTLCPLYINEKTPKEMSGKVGAIFQVYACAGVLVAYALALALPTGDYDSDPMNYWWMFMFSWQGLLAFAHFLMFKVYFRLDTPVSLLDRGLDEKAVRSLCEIYPKDEAIKMVSKDDNKGSIASYNSTLSTSKRMEHGYMQLLFCKDGRGKMMRLGIMASVVQEFSGIIPLLAYLTTIFNAFGGGVFISRSLTTVSGFVKIVSVIIVLPFIDKWGRRPIFIWGSIFMGLFTTLVGVFSEFVHTSYIVPFLLIELFLVAYEASSGPLCWIYCGEILCPKGMSIAISSNWLFMTITALTFPFLIDLFGIGVTFFIYGSLNFLLAFYSWADFIETKGLDKNSIQSLLFTKSN